MITDTHTLMSPSEARSLQSSGKVPSLVEIDVLDQLVSALEKLEARQSAVQDAVSSLLDTLMLARKLGLGPAELRILHAINVLQGAHDYPEFVEQKHD